MNPGEPEDPLESQLGRLRPAPVPTALMARLVAAKPPVKVVGLSRASILRLAAAAAVVLGIGLWRIPILERFSGQPFRAAQNEEIQVFAPAWSERYLVRARDVGVVMGPGDQPYRLVHCAWIDHEVYAAADTEVRAEALKPHEQIVPIAMEVY